MILCSAFAFNANAQIEWKTVDNARLSRIASDNESSKLVLVQVVDDVFLSIMVNRNVEAHLTKIGSVMDLISENFITLQLSRDVYNLRAKELKQPTRVGHLIFDNQLNLIGGIARADGFNYNVDQVHGVLNFIKNNASEISRLTEKFKKGGLSIFEKMDFAVLMKTALPERGERLKNEINKTLSKEIMSDSRSVEFLSLFTNDFSHPLIRSIEEGSNGSLLANLSESDRGKLVGNVANNFVVKSLAVSDQRYFDYALNTLLPMSLRGDDHDLLRFQLSKYYFGTLRNLVAYQKAVEDYAKSASKLESNFWLVHSADIFNNGQQTPERNTIVLSWLEKALESKKDYDTYFYYAFALAIKGDFNNALVNAEKAKSLAQDDKSKSQIDQLIEQINNAQKK